MRRIKNKLRSRGGFTLAEMLTAVLIMLLLTAIVAGGLPVAQKVYIDVTDAANAQVLLSTTITELTDELASSRAVVVGAGNVLQKFESGLGLWSEVSSETNGITLVEYSGIPGSLGSSRSTLLVTAKAATKNLVSSFDSITFSGGVFTVTNLRVQKDGSDLASLAEFKIAAINTVSVQTA